MSSGVRAFALVTFALAIACGPAAKPPVIAEEPGAVPDAAEAGDGTHARPPLPPVANGAIRGPVPVVGLER